MTHEYRATVTWTGNRGPGTREYRGYRRDHIIEVDGKPPLPGTSSTGFGQDPGRYNPEELVIASLAACHMLWYLHLCADAGVVVTAYSDPAEGTLELERDGSGRFISAVLRPRVTIREGAQEVAERLHEEAHRRCYVASSMNFPVRCEPTIVRETPVGSA